MPTLELYAPTSDELWFKRDLLADPETMSYNEAWGGTIPFPEEMWQRYWDAWLSDPDNARRLYRYLRRSDTGEFVGEVAYHWDADLQVFIADVIVHARHRGKGYGSEGLELLCAAAKERGLTELWDCIAFGNPSYELFLRHGFESRGQNESGRLVRRVL